MYKIYHIEDDPIVADAVRTSLSAEQKFEYTWQKNAENVHQDMESLKPDLVLLDLHLSSADDADGLDILKSLNKSSCPIIVYSSDISLLRQSLKLGAGDFIYKTQDTASLPLRLLHYINQNIAPRESYRSYAGQFMQEVTNHLAKIRKSSIRSILINGESGTGKETVVDTFAGMLPSSTPMIKVNCAALSPSLVESELFGHLKGSFTGAHSDRRGYFEAANNGWLFLDEVTCLPGSAQAALLRAIENQEISRVGETNTRKINVKIISATNESIETLVAAGRFRKDLWQRLQEVCIDLKPLRERKGDLQEIVDHLCAGEEGGPYTMSTEALSILKELQWKNGNIRELRNCIRAMTAYHVGKVLVPAGIPEWIWDIYNAGEDDEDCRAPLEHSKMNLSISLDPDQSYENACDQLLVELIRQLAKSPGSNSIRIMAARLGLPKSTLANKIKRVMSRGVITEDELKKIWPK